jgi:hypothetical protein
LGTCRCVDHCGNLRVLAEEPRQVSLGDQCATRTDWPIRKHWSFPHHRFKWIDGRRLDHCNLLL